MTLREEQSAFAKDLVRLLVFAEDCGYEVTIGEVERPLEMQRIHMAAGRSMTMNSMHLKRCAADLHFFKDGVLCYPEQMGEFWEALDERNQWGGNWKTFKDQPHFQRTV